MSVTKLKRTQIQGKKYDLPEEEVSIQKLIKKGINLDTRIKALKKDLDTVKNDLIEIATNRREKATTVKLQAVAGISTVTFRDSYVSDDRVMEIEQDLGSLFGRFFTKKVDYKTSKDLKQFLEGEHAYGLDDPEPVKKLILTHVKRKSTKPNVKIIPMDK